MRRVRVIPVLLIENGRLVKTKKFETPIYLGDPINAVRIFNEKLVDELCILDISKNRDSKPNMDLLRNIAGEAFMPLSYGGGISQISEVKEILKAGFEKIIFNTCAYKNPAVIKEACEIFGSSSIVVSIDYKKNLLGRNSVYVEGGRINTKKDPVNLVSEMQAIGVGEFVIQSIDRDGTYKGYDIDVLQKVSQVSKVPIIALGGASSIEDFKDAIKNGHASAVAAGSYFVFKQPHNAVLITYPEEKTLKKELYSLIN